MVPAGKPCPNVKGATKFVVSGDAEELLLEDSRAFPELLGTLFPVGVLAIEGDPLKPPVSAGLVLAVALAPSDCVKEDPRFGLVSVLPPLLVVGDRRELVPITLVAETTVDSLPTSLPGLVDSLPVLLIGLTGLVGILVGLVGLNGMDGSDPKTGSLLAPEPAPERVRISSDDPEPEPGSLGDPVSEPGLGMMVRVKNPAVTTVVGALVIRKT